MLQDTPPDAIVAHDAADRRRARPALSRVRPHGTRMEQWSFPPRYDAATCRPPARATGSPRARRCRAAEREAAILARLKDVTRYAWDHAPFYRRKWDEAGFHPDHLRSLEDFESKVPVIDEKGPARRAGARAAVRRLSLRARQRDLPRPRHVGHHRAADRVRASAATTGMPSPMRMPESCGAWAFGPATRCSSRRSSASTWAPGARSPAPSGCARKAFPFGAGAPGMTARAAMWLDSMKPRGVLRHAVVCAASCRGRARSEGFDPRNFGLRDDVLLRRARRVGAGRARPHRRSVWRARDRLRLDGRDDAVHERRGTAETDGMLLLAGHRLHRGLRPEDVSPRPLRPARHAGVHPPRAHVAADDPAALRRPHAVGATGRHRAAAPIRACRRASSDASTTCSRSAAKTSIRARSTP